jgi:hypothetical protein
MRGFLLTCVIALVSSHALAQNSLSGGDYEWMVIHKSKSLLEGHVDIGMKSFEGATVDGIKQTVHITFESANPANNLDVKARRLDFEYEAGALSRITLTGAVDVDHPAAAIASNSAVIEVLKNSAVFTGNVVITSEKSGEANGDKATFNFETGLYTIKNPGMKIPFGQDKGSAAAYLLKESDVTDWTEFLKTLQASAKSDDPSPGARLVSLLPERYPELIRDSDIGNLDNSRPVILKLLNKNLQKPELYDPEAWKGITLTPDVTGMLSGDSITDPKTIVWLNRSLLQAAYPQYLTSPPPLESSEGKN